MTDGLKEAHRSAIVDVLRANPRVERAVLFGSRAKQTFTLGSDVDIALFGESLTTADQARLAADMDELTVPQRVDLLLYDGIEDAALRKHIRQDGIELHRRERRVAQGHLHLTERHREMLVALLREHLPGVDAWAYGSRVDGRSHDGSDLDLALRGPGLKDIPVGQLADFREALYESTIPFLVEARDWARLPERFRCEIEQHHVTLDAPERPVACGEPHPKDWAPLNLGHVCTKLGSGATPRGGKKVYLASGPYALIRSQNVLNDGFRTDGIAYIGSEHASALQNVEVAEGDVLLNITGDSVARVCQVHPDVLPARVNQHVAIIRPDPAKLDPLFLRYFLVSPKMQSELLSLASSGGTRNALTKAMIQSLLVAAPRDVDQQRAIADILGALDDKIELNRRMNGTLEAMARALFKSWFVDFEPVRATTIGRNSAVSQYGRDLFPSRLVDSNIGPVPEGWNVSEIGKEVAAVGGATPSTKVDAYWNGGRHAWATPKDLSNLTAPVLLDTAKKVTDAGLAKIGSGLLPSGTVLMSSRAPIGYLAIADTPVAINQGFIAMVCEKRLPNLYVLCWCRENLRYIKNIAGGSTFAEISKKVFRPIPVLVPPPRLLQSFVQIAGPLYARIVSNLKQAENLAAIRDGLLPKLISGELRLSDAERMVGSMT